MHAGAFNQHIYRLHKKGIVDSHNSFIRIHRHNLRKFSVSRHSIMRDIFPNKTEKVLISFDIPQTKKKIRDWLRNQIKYWDFKMIHQSLWLGYGPLPKEFNDRLKQLGIDKNVRIFKVRQLT